MKVSAARKAQFCDALVRGGSPATAAQAIGVDRSTVFRWKAADPSFREAWDAARETKVETIETILYRQAARGDLGAICFFLKAHRPELYNRRMAIAFGSDPDNPLTVDHLHHSDVETVHIYMPANGRDQPEALDDTPTTEDEADEAA